MANNDKLEAVRDAALAALPDLRYNGHKARHSYRLCKISRSEYSSIVARYKKVRDALYHAGHLPANWDDGLI